MSLFTQSSSSSFYSPITKTFFRINSLCPLTGASIIAESHNNVVLITLCSEKLKVDNSCPLPDIAPLTVNYSEKFDSVGLIPFQPDRRDKRPTTKDILTSRMIDRSLRPLIPPLIGHTIEINCEVLSMDKSADIQTMALNGASLALQICGLPLLGSCASVRTGIRSSNKSEILIQNQETLNSTDFDLTLTANGHRNILMMEGYSKKFVKYSSLMRAIVKSSEIASKIIQESKSFIEQNRMQIPENEHFVISENEIESLCVPILKSFTTDSFQKLFHSKLLKQDFIELSKELKSNAQVEFLKEFPERTAFFDILYKHLSNFSYQNSFILQQKEQRKRIDGRASNQLRPLECKIGPLLNQHGSALFSRGLTKVLTTITLGPKSSAMKYDDPLSYLMLKKDSKFFLHYDFPSYCNGEISQKAPGLLNRREVGHGNLASNALKVVLPDKMEFSVRALTKVLSSNGSSSMATVCSSVAALEDAGIKLKKRVAGVALGLISQKPKISFFPSPNTGNFEQTESVILSDITGMEDALGNIDFKMASTAAQEVTALQMDTKNHQGIDLDTISQLMVEGTRCNNQILQVIDSACSKLDKTEELVKKKKRYPVKQSHELTFGLNPSALLNKRFTEKLMEISGSNIDEIIETREGSILKIFSPDQEKAKIALELLKSEEVFSHEMLEIGAIYPSKIVEVLDTGILVELGNRWKPTFVHASSLKPGPKYSNKVDILNNLKIGDEILLKYIGINPLNGQIKLSQRAIYAPDSNLLINKMSRNVQEISS